MEVQKREAGGVWGRTLVPSGPVRLKEPKSDGEQQELAGQHEGAEGRSQRGPVFARLHG